MRQAVSLLTQSQFYSPAFNAAIFDGPVRIYFAQYQESLALKIYFRIQERLKGVYESLPESLKYSTQHLFLMVYPNQETFSHSFPQSQASMGSGQLGEDVVMGVQAPVQEEDIDLLVSKVEPLIRSWMTMPSALEHPVNSEAF
jgi:hypothetical protein